MPVATQHDGKRTWRLYTPRQSLLRLALWLGALILLTLSWREIAARTEWAFVRDSWRVAEDIATRMMPPEWSYTEVLLRPLWDTINIATLGTLLALVLAVPVAFLAARNTTPSAAFVRPVALFVIVSSRSINSLIWALLLVTIVGPGVFAGIIAIALRSIGFCAKLLYEAIEEISPVPVEAVAATGAGPGQLLDYGIVPQVLPAFAGISIFRWDINIRESTVLGYVGAGGIGLQLSASVAELAWAKVAVILLMILALVGLAEWASAKIRKLVI